jgi:hypothetical protein
MIFGVPNDYLMTEHGLMLVWQHKKKAAAASGTDPK